MKVLAGEVVEITSLAEGLRVALPSDRRGSDLGTKRPEGKLLETLLKRMRVQSRQDFVRYAASPLVRPCTSHPYCNWRRFDSWNLLDPFDQRSRQVTHPSDGDSRHL